MERITRVTETNTKRIFPQYVRMEKVWITPDNHIIIQINGLRKKLPLSQLIDSAKETRFHREPTLKNVLKWSDFTEIAHIPIPENSVEINIGKRVVSPSYSLKNDKLGYNHKELVKLEGEESQKLFKSGTVHYRIRKNDEEAHYVPGWALMRKEKFPHDRDWVMFYLLKSTENKYAKPRQ